MHEYILRRQGGAYMPFSTNSVDQLCKEQLAELPAIFSFYTSITSDYIGVVGSHEAVGAMNWQVFPSIQAEHCQMV